MNATITTNTKKIIRRKIVKPNVYFEITDEKPSIIFTRYLYIKHEVEISLILSVLGKRKDEALFWAYELYYSGFEYDAFELLSILYEDYFQEHDEGERLGTFLNAQCLRWSDDNSSDDTIANIVLNMIRTKYRFSPKKESRIVVSTEVASYEPTATGSRGFYIVATQEDIAKYKTLTQEGQDPAKILAKVCLFTPIRSQDVELPSRPKKVQYDSDGIAIRTKYGHHWLYYASLSPVWKFRINLYGGTTNHDKKRIDFSDDESADRFNDQYFYDPEEQNIEIMRRNIP
jgi:hypothetical protein